jgi:hypothetical protein
MVDQSSDKTAAINFQHISNPNRNSFSMYIYDGSTTYFCKCELPSVIRKTFTPKNPAIKMAGTEFFLNPPREIKTHQVARTDFAMWYHRCQCLTSHIHEIAETTNPQNT